MSREAPGSRIKEADLTTAEFFRYTIFLWMSSTYERSPDRIWISEVAGCLRRAYLERVEPPKYDYRQCMVMFIGDALHRNLYRALKAVHGDSFREEVKIEVPVYDELTNDVFTLVGKADLVCEDPKTVIEVKTCSEIPRKPLPVHVRQLQYYLNLMKIDRGVLLYVSRDGDLRAFPLKRDEGYAEELLARAKYLFRCIKRGRVPRPDPAPYNCNGCIYRLTGRCKLG